MVDRRPDLAELQARPQRLHPHMVLLVDHHAHRFVPVQNQSAAGTLRRVFAADEMSLHQDLFVERREVVHGLRECLVHLRQGLDRGPDDVENPDALRLLGPAGKRGVVDVPGQTDAAGHHDPVVGAFAPGGFRRRCQKLIKVHRFSAAGCLTARSFV